MDEHATATNNVTTAANTGLVISEEWFGRTVVLGASGVIDMLTSPQLEASIATSVKKNPNAVIVDLTDVDFLASAGMGVLVAAHADLAPAVRLVIVADSPTTSRPLKLVGIADLIELFATRDEALAAVTA